MAQAVRFLVTLIKRNDGTIDCTFEPYKSPEADTGVWRGQDEFAKAARGLRLSPHTTTRILNILRRCHSRFPEILQTPGKTWYQHSVEVQSLVTALQEAAVCERLLRCYGIGPKTLDTFYRTAVWLSQNL